MSTRSWVVVLSVHYQIAQKLHACTEVPAEGSNPRVHDIYDILLLAVTVENAGARSNPGRMRGHLHAPRQTRVATGPDGV